MPEDREYAIMLLQANGWSAEDAEGFYDIIINQIKLADNVVQEMVTHRLSAAIAKAFWCQCGPEKQRPTKVANGMLCEFCALMIKPEETA